MKRLAAIILLLLLSAPAQAQDLKLPKTVFGEPGDFIQVAAETKGKTVRWYMIDRGLKQFPADLLKDTKTAIFSSAVPGKYRIIAWTAIADDPSQAAECLVVIQGIAPPVPPDPPGPTPGPVPIPGPGFRVLVVYETAVPQQFASAKVRAYLNEKCALGPDGKTKEWRVLDQNTVFSEQRLWQDAMARPRAQIPWVIISNGTSGFEGPLPATVDETLKLLQKYGG